MKYLQQNQEIPLDFMSDLVCTKEVSLLACDADSCKHPCTQSAQQLQFACSSFHENKKPFLIGYFGLV